MVSTWLLAAGSFCVLASAIRIIVMLLKDHRRRMKIAHKNYLDAG